MRKTHFYFPLLLMTLLFSCTRELDNNEPATNEPIQDIQQLAIPRDFNYATTQSVNLKLKAVNNTGKTLNNIPISIYRKDGDSTALLLKGRIGKDGVFQETLTLDATTTELLLYTPYPGLPSFHQLPVNSSILNYVLGSDNVIGFNGSPEDHRVQGPVSGVVTSRLNTASRANEITSRDTKIHVIGKYDDQGKPEYLEIDDVINQDLLDLVAANLPEAQPVPTYHPEYLEKDVTSSVVLKEEAEVWVTFVHEGAGYRNVLGYYVYDTKNPPQNEQKIDTLFVIFPNVSFNGSGGGLNTGNKVKLGKFPAGKTIGWFLMPDGWDGNSVNPRPEKDYATKYSDKQLNTFTSEQYRTHTVLLQDPTRELLLLGFEDLNRPGGDNDFNDAIFYVTAVPFSAINTDNLVETRTTGNDDDDDGVANNNDDFPDDSEIAFTTYTPSKDQEGTLAFEDLWPSQGDYDMNDLVIDYNVIEYRNAANKVAKIKASFLLRAIGAGLQSGFAFELPIPAANVKSVKGSKLFENYIQLQSNGVEAKQTNAVIIVFDNGQRVMASPIGGFINTRPGDSYVNPVRIEVEVELIEPVSSNILGAAPFNPFLIAGRKRGFEIHLPDFAPTDLADLSIFGTSQDDSDAGQQRFYKTKNNLPWAINLAETFDYPIEKQPINEVYKKFADWATSGGRNQKNWYKKSGGNRNEALIY